tara:strand:- start:15051 stop:15386 length:336 start_codon:yes stop_codon:yes gene_type:complete
MNAEEGRELLGGVEREAQRLNIQRIIQIFRRQRQYAIGSILLTTIWAVIFLFYMQAAKYELRMYKHEIREGHKEIVSKVNILITQKENAISELQARVGLLEDRELDLAALR